MELRRQLKSLWKRFESQDKDFSNMKQKLYDLEARKRNRDYNIVTDKQRMRNNIFADADEDADADGFGEKEADKELYAGMDEDMITMSKIKALTAGMPGLDFLNNMEQGAEQADFMEVEQAEKQQKQQQKSVPLSTATSNTFAPSSRVLGEQAAVPYTYSEDAWAAAAGMAMVEKDISNQGLHGGALHGVATTVRSGIVQAPVPVAITSGSGSGGKNGENSLMNALLKAGRGARKVAKVPQLYNGQAVPRQHIQMPNQVTRLGSKDPKLQAQAPVKKVVKNALVQPKQNTTRLNIQDESAQLLQNLTFTQDATLTSMEFIPQQPTTTYVKESRDVEAMVEA